MPTNFDPDRPLVYAWPCGHVVEPDEAMCMHCYRDRLYGGNEDHDAVRLFKPAPEQMPGQMGLEL